MSDYLIGRILSSDRITLHPYTEIVELEGGRHLEAVTWKQIQTGCMAVCKRTPRGSSAPDRQWMASRVGPWSGTP